MSEVSQKQIEANRQNAKLGGAKTEEAKAVSRYNAIKHGILSENVLFKDEDENELIELGKRLRSEMKPDTEFELLLIDRIISNFWRLKRVMGMERDSVISKGTFSRGLELNERIADTYFRYETMLERGIYKALHELQRLQATRSGEKIPAPVAIDVDVSKD